MNFGEVVHDAGPIAYSHIELCEDPDLELALIENGFDPAATTYRLIEIPIDRVAEAASMGGWQHMGDAYVEAVRSGVQFPPVVVLRTSAGWGLLDGVNRTYAYWKLSRPTLRAYELLS